MLLDRKFNEDSKNVLKTDIFFNSKWVLQAILFLTVLSNCVFGSSNFDTTFLTDCTKFGNGFSCCWIGNLMRIPKMCLEH